MPVAVKDTQSGATTTVTPGSPTRITGTKSTFAVTAGSPTVITGTPITSHYLVVRLQFNATGTAPTVLSVSGDAAGDAYFAVDIGSQNPNSFGIRWTYPGPATITPVLSAVTGAFNQVAQSAYYSGGPGGNTYRIWEFQLKQNGIVVAPASGNLCTITLN